MSVVIVVLSAAVAALSVLVAGGILYIRQLEERLNNAFDSVGDDISWLDERLDTLEDNEDAIRSAPPHVLEQRPVSPGGPLPSLG